MDSYITYSFISCSVCETKWNYRKNLGDCVVPAFALISGYLFWSNISNITDVGLKMKRRIYTLLIPYLLWNFLNTIMRNIMNNGYRNIFNINVLTDIIQWNSSPHFWYIFMLMFWTVFVPVLYLAYKDKRILTLLFLSQGLYLIHKGGAIQHSRFIYILYTWGGYIGYNYSDLWEKIEELSEKKKNTIGVCAFTSYMILGILTSLDMEMQIKVWIYVIRAIFLIIGSFVLPEIIIGRRTGYRFSFWIFAIHYWLDVYVSAFISKYVGGIFYQLTTWEHFGQSMA